MHIDVGTYGSFTPFVFSVPPHHDEEDESFIHEAHVVVNLTGETSGAQKPKARLSLTLDEAEDLIRRLQEVTAAARGGVYSGIGRESIGDAKLVED